MSKKDKGASFSFTNEKFMLGCLDDKYFLNFSAWPKEDNQGVIQGVFEIINRFWAHKNRRPNFDKLTKNKVFTKALISKGRANHKLPPMYIKHYKPVI